MRGAGGRSFWGVGGKDVEGILPNKKVPSCRRLIRRVTVHLAVVAPKDVLGGPREGPNL